MTLTLWLRLDVDSALLHTGICVTWHFFNSDDNDISSLSRGLHSLSLRFNGHFPGEPGLAGVH